MLGSKISFPSISARRTAIDPGTGGFLIYDKLVSIASRNGTQSRGSIEWGAKTTESHIPTPPKNFHPTVSEGFGETFLFLIGRKGAKGILEHREGGKKSACEVAFTA